EERSSTPGRRSADADRQAHPRPRRRADSSSGPRAGRSAGAEGARAAHHDAYVTSGVAPDAIGPVIGWRAWAITRDRGSFRLRSIVAPTVWQPEVPLVARCLRPRLRPWRRHVAPAESCECGIYAADLAGGLEYARGSGG